MTTSLKRRVLRDRSRRLGLIKDERPCPCRECGHTRTHRHVAGWPVRSGPRKVIGSGVGIALVDHEYLETLADGRKRYCTQPYPIPGSDGKLSPTAVDALHSLEEAGYIVKVLPPGYGRHNDGVLFIVIEEPDAN